MFDRPGIGSRAVLVHMPLAGPDQEDLDEFRLLSLSAGAEAVATLAGRLRAVDPRFYIGQGKLEELAETVKVHEADLVLFNHALTPSQERNLEKALNIRVVDRNGLILDIFAQRARSFEGRLQVELAQLKHLSTRLVRGWTHLERQKGGIGLRGPGETQLETDKRLLANRIRQIQKRLQQVEVQRDQGRQARRRAQVPVVGLVGYTNAGKSTLFNALTRADVYAADQLFATLDPTLRRLSAGGLDMVLADTVGFIRHLPHELVAAFRSTLQESAEADLLLHVVDATDERMDETIAEVRQVLAEIGADRIPCVEVYNKVDGLDGVVPHVERNASGRPARVWISARSGAGLDLLKGLLEEVLGGGVERRILTLTAGQGQLRARLYREARILWDEPDGEGGWRLSVEFPASARALRRAIGDAPERADCEDLLTVSPR
ncbi:GTP-binding protein [Methylococcus capsulatus str. Bath]|uniref:GTPase HflX n=1 Tax=Methylococcus capsulatus (strain ATCC 33009 / NCIMB 11132 / Bath) TaxID=243233 RepID=Q606N4_METCA|nr:ribosome rescue GTPase HflX [Methylococcus capsulatus]AAU91986.1 GTP-binding protein [Methylococcus capsulatus str. Bath]